MDNNTTEETESSWCDDDFPLTAMSPMVMNAERAWPNVDTLSDLRYEMTLAKNDLAYHQENYKKIPYSASHPLEICDHRLTDAEFRLLMYMRFRQGAKAYTEVGVETIAAHLGYDDADTVSKHLMNLERNGFMSGRQPDVKRTKLRAVAAPMEQYQPDAFKQIYKWLKRSESPKMLETNSANLRSLNESDLRKRPKARTKKTR